MTNFKELIKKYPTLFTAQNVEKNNLLYRVDEPIKKLHYSENGIFRVYSSHKGNEITRGFFFENEAVIPIMALTNNIPVFVNIEALEDCTMQIISIENWKKIEKQEPDLIKDVLLGVFSNILKHFYSYQLISSYPADKRIKAFLNMYPALNRVKQDYLASILVMRKETFCKKKP